MILVLYPQEILKLPSEILECGIRRGKGLKRVEATAKRQASGCDRWTIYEALKGNRTIDSTLIQTIEAMKAEEAKEGILEYLTTQFRR